MAEISDDILLQRVAGGDMAAMKALYTRHETAMYRFILTRLQDRFEAADALNEAMLDVWRSAGRFGGGSSVRTWMFSIARNKAVDRLRKTARLVTAEPDDSLPDDALNPEEAAAASSDAARVRACLDTLPDAHRAALNLAFYQDLSYPEIAGIEEVPVGTIKSRVHAAKKLMALCLGGR